MISGGGMASRSCNCAAGWAGAILWVFTFLFSVHSYASSEIVLDPERQLQFAEQYFQRGEYYRAIGEYERFIYFFPGSNKIEHARYRIALSYLKGDRYEEAIEAFYPIIEEYRDTRYAFKSYLGVSEAYVKLTRYAMALTSLTNLITIVTDGEIRDEAYYQRAWVYLEMGLRGKAIESLEQISPQNRQRYDLNGVLVRLKAGTEIETKNPTIAGILAIVPGAGHLYCGRKRDALISFVVNGAMIYAAYEAFDNDLNALGATIALVGLGFYGGNIYGAVSSAHKYNRDKRRRFIDSLKEGAGIDLSLGRGNGWRCPLLLCHVPF
jgi:tetratricopeptide (TPR) repeat protein